MGRDPVPPILLGEARLALSACCSRCKHEVQVDAMALPLPDDLDMNQVGHRMRCSGCGRRGGHTAYPEPAGWVRWVRSKGWRHRESWFATMIRQ